MDQHGFVDDQESVVELVRGLDRERVAVLGVSLFVDGRRRKQKRTEFTKV